MGFFDWLSRLLRRLFGGGGDDNEEERQRERNTLESDGPEPKVEVAFWQSKELTERRGRMPEKMAAKYIAQAIEDAGYNYKIHYGFKEEFNPPQENNSVDTWQWWVENSPETAVSCNMLLYDGRGGRAAIGGINAITGLKDVNEVQDEAKRTCGTQACGNVWAAIHEFGHSLGGRHKTPMMKDKPMMLFSENMKDLIDKRMESGEIRTL